MKSTALRMTSAHENLMLADLQAIVSSNKSKRWWPSDVWPHGSPAEQEFLIAFATVSYRSDFDQLLANRGLARTTDGYIVVADYRITNGDGTAAPTPARKAARKTKGDEPGAAVGLLEPPPSTVSVVSSTERTTHHLDVGKLFPSPWNPRLFSGKDVDNPELVGLGESIKAQGLIQPITVRPYRPWFVVRDSVVGSYVLKRRDAKAKGDGEHSYVAEEQAKYMRDERNREFEGSYEIVAGERRWRASKVAKLPTIECFIIELSDQDAIQVIVTENLQRKDLSVLEESRGVCTLLANGWTEATVADKLGRAPSWVARRAQIQRLSPKIMKMIEGADMNAEARLHLVPPAHLTLLARLDHATQEAFVDRFEYDLESMTESEWKNSINAYLRRVDKTPWDPTDATLVAAAGPCSSCPRRSDRQSLLFDFEGDEAAIEQQARCLDPACFDEKAVAHAKRVATVTAEKSGFEVTMVLDLNDERTKDFDDPAKDRGTLLHQITPCKKTEKGAKPAVIGNGPRAGQVVWFNKKSESTSRFQADLRMEREKAKAAAGEPPLKSLKERRDELNKRRKMHALKVAAENVRESGHVPTTRIVLACAAVYGTDQPNKFSGFAEDAESLVNGWDDPGEMVSGKIVDAGPVPLLKRNGHAGYKKAKKHSDLVALMAGLNGDKDLNDVDGEGVACRVLWHSVREVMLTWFTCSWTPRDENVREMVDVATLLVPLAIPSMTFADFLKAAEEAIPEPKSWANLNLDGSPKGTFVSGKTAAAGDDTPEPVAKKKSKHSLAQKNHPAAVKKRAIDKKLMKAAKKKPSSSGRRSAAGAAS